MFVQDCYVCTSDAYLAEGDIYLRPWKMTFSDVTGLHNIYSNNEVAAWSNVPCYRSRIDAVCDVRRFVSEQIYLAVCVASLGDKPVGILGGRIASGNSKIAVINYALNPEFEHRGIMCTAVRLFTAWLFNRFAIDAVVGNVYKGNCKSSRCLLRCGYILYPNLSFYEDTLSGTLHADAYIIPREVYNHSPLYTNCRHFF